MNDSMGKTLICKIRKWELSDAKELAAALSNQNIQDNLRDGLPYPYTEQDGVDFISAMLSAYMQSPLHTILPPAGYLKKRDLHMRVR